jgi:hypothetical protein
VPSERRAGAGPPSIPDSISAASTYGEASVDLRVAEDLVEESLAIEDIARRLLSNALRDRA